LKTRQFGLPDLICTHGILSNAEHSVHSEHSDHSAKCQPKVPHPPAVRQPIRSPRSAPIRSNSEHQSIQRTSMHYQCQVNEGARSAGDTERSTTTILHQFSSQGAARSHRDSRYTPDLALSLANICQMALLCTSPGILRALASSFLGVGDSSNYWLGSVAVNVPLLDLGSPGFEPQSGLSFLSHILGNWYLLEGIMQDKVQSYISISRHPAPFIG
jgi:hypothetical protein